MSETPHSTPEVPIPDQQSFGEHASVQQPSLEGSFVDANEGDFGGHEANLAAQVADQVPDQAPGEVPGQVPEETTQAPHASWETADQKRAMYAVWLKGRGIDPATAPHIS